jgi:hypothetical protein
MSQSFAHLTNTEAWVVFSGQTDLPWLRVLKKGFRHCYVLLNDGTGWISVDPLSSMMDVRVQPVPTTFDLPLWLQDRGLKVLPAVIKPQTKQAPWMPFTCVEAVKRVLGIHKRFLFTPWQLYRHLQSSHQKGEPSWAV